ncbi:MAG: 16S rRNA (adenine(1518)-N(6)/adenine(1519)-N(6))-dimethyltransferase RsmA [Angelakisella sp.]|jgi:16S rRNA (adenine1518-N6/adenine1519-N6)-dimethyltransferase|nr:16S rRNA (adenine(1518)-N(6)/adenine(1519)-N(6))-dimethyltransferase RsmA [Angelakisella sp.]
MGRLTDRGVIRDVMERHGFTFSKSLGQNFIVNPSVCPRIAQEGGAAPGVGVIEIGAGIGVLTAELARRADKVVCVEIDRRLLPILAETLAEFSNITIVNADVMKTDLAALIVREFPGMEVVVCANLPYYITSPILMSLLEQRLPIRSITVMVQKEAAQRICAQPGTRDSGAISAAVRYYSQPRVLFPVSRGSFFPAPEVDSAVIRLDLHPTPPVAVADEATLFRVIRGAFGQRRKTVLNTLSAALELPKEETRALLEQAGVPATARAEALTLEQFAAIAGGVWSREQNKA